MLDNPFNQPIIPRPDELTMFDEVDRIVASSVAAGDPVIALEYGKELVGSALMRGLALAKLLYKLRENWALFQTAGTGDTLEDMVYTHVGRSPETVKKYIRMWESIFENEDVPDDVKNRLRGRSMPELLLMTAVIREGTTPEVLKELADAPDHTAVREIIARENGGRTSSGSSLYIRLQVRDGAQTPRGTLSVMKGKKREDFGTLNLDTGDPDVERAIERLVNSAHIKEIL